MLRPRQRLDKYRIEKRIAQGGFAEVYQAYDTVEGIRVALKIPNLQMLAKEDLESFRREVRLTARLDHPHILPIKNAGLIDHLFVIVHPLGIGSLADRVTRRLSFQKALNYADQILQALAFAHGKRIIHCDVKPENLILFPRDQLRLADFGLAKIARTTTLSASGSGTVGYVAPEQALGRPSPRSDVFSAGLVIYRLLAGALPRWPFEWPPPNYARLCRDAHPDLIAFVRRALRVEERGRFANACVMLAAFRRLRKVRKKIRSKAPRSSQRLSWKNLRTAEFRRGYGTLLGTNQRCRRCSGPMSEMMKGCPWCGYHTRVYRGSTTFALRCRRCGHGMKTEWKFCCMCYGAAQGPRSNRIYPDRRYTARCSSCSGPLMPFMRYCPWCRRKVIRGWKIGKSREKCSSCSWGVLRDFWEYCPWCTSSL